MIVYVNADTQEIYTRPRRAGAGTRTRFHLSCSRSHAQAATFEQWLADQRDLGLLVVEIDDISTTWLLALQVGSYSRSTGEPLWSLGIGM